NDVVARPISVDHDGSDGPCDGAESARSDTRYGRSKAQSALRASPCQSGAAGTTARSHACAPGRPPSRLSPSRSSLAVLAQRLTSASRQVKQVYTVILRYVQGNRRRLAPSASRQRLSQRHPMLGSWRRPSATEPEEWTNGSRGAWQLDTEGGAATRPTAARADPAAVILHHLLADGEPQPEQSARPSALPEGFEDADDLIPRKPDPGVPHVERHAVRSLVGGADDDVAVPAHGGDGIPEQVPEHLMKPDGVRQ